MWTILLLALSFGPQAQAPDGISQAPTYRVTDALPGVSTYPIPKIAFLSNKRVGEELELTADQQARQADLEARYVRTRTPIPRGGDREKARAELLKERNAFESKSFDLLTPIQKTRLDQIELQYRVLSAFAGKDLPGRLGLSEEEITRVRAIVAEGIDAMEKASTISLTFPTIEAPKTLDGVRNLVLSPEFKASKAKAWSRIDEAHRETRSRIERALSDRERENYRGLLGRPFDVGSIWDDSSKNMPLERELALVALHFGFTTGQRPDPDFDTKVAKPAYTGDKHPKVLFDEAHHNFHTASGRYKAFADLITHDGYVVTPNREPFTASSLAGSDVLVIANALGAEGMGHPDAGNSAFTAAECDAVRDWVEAGGSLLLITDHQPFGDAADALAKRFGVDMSKGVASDDANEQERGLLFSREKGLIGDHAITRGRDDSERVDRVLTFTGQSLKGPEGSVPFLKFSETAVDQGEAGQKSAAGRAQGIAFARGKGRVVVMGEAAQLSAQVFGLPPTPMGMNVPGSDNRRMALNTMHWLSRLVD